MKMLQINNQRNNTNIEKTFNDAIVLIFIFVISGSSILSDKWYVIGYSIVLCFIFILKGKKISRKILLIVAIWLTINILAVFLFKSQFIALRIIHYTVRILILPYLILTLIGANFWYRFEKLVFLLTVISLPLFILNIIFQNDFNNLTHIFRPLTREIFSRFNTESNYWTSLFYVNAIHDGQYLRNSGFMWEPGSFSLILIWAIIFNWLTSGIKINIRIITYIVAIISTLSTAGYIALSIVLIAVFVRRLNITNILLLTVLIAIFWNYIYKLDFVGGEIDYYYEVYDKDILRYNNDYQLYKVNRFQGAKYDLQKTLSYPLGFGVVSKKDYTDEAEIYGVNGISNLLVMWGIPMFIVFMFYTKKIFHLYNKYHYGEKIILLFFIGFMIMIFSNPIAKNAFFYIIALTPIFLKRHEKYRR